MVKAYQGQVVGIILLLKRNKWTYKQIANKMHCHPDTIRRYCTVYRKLR